MLALCTLSLQLPGYKLALNDRKSGVCMCVWVGGGGGGGVDVGVGGWPSDTQVIN